ncbi:methyltransferase [Shewanella sp. 202IG2-18]|uniref:methyltransferase n=1 Tax=Parashewanella hymeniacidonis TaxID=2807618 RepID=UPI0019617C71|nr:methyltransferase [Parashewanella hymeniacidonis]MBM7073323.1 methyltransferase [Parashewanella hymeniacidonis]
MNLIDLTLLFVVILAVLSIVWSTLKTGISPMMSSSKARDAILDELELEKEGAVIDLGSGWGTLVIPLAKKYPNKQIVGYELSLLPWSVSVILKHSLGLDNLTIHRKDFINADFDTASNLVCYLFPGAMIALQDKLEKEVVNEVTIVSNTFALPSYKPTKVTKISDFYRSPIYVYHWPQK